MTNQEPNRDDYTKSTSKSRPESEQLTDIELNYKYTDKHFYGQVTLYNMTYKNQLVLTGAVNDVGNYTRSNVAESYRRGIELQTKWIPTDKISLGMNLTLSENKIKEFVEFTDEYDADFNYAGQSKIVFNNTNIAFSPAVIGNVNFTYQFNEHLSASIIERYIDNQYLDMRIILKSLCALFVQRLEYLNAVYRLKSVIVCSFYRITLICSSFDKRILF